MDDLTKKLFSRINESNKKIKTLVKRLNESIVENRNLESSLQMQKNAQMYKTEQLKKKNKTIAEAYNIQEKQLKNYAEYMNQMKDKIESLEEENRELKKTNKQYLEAIKVQQAFYEARENKIKDIVQNPEIRRLKINF